MNIDDGGPAFPNVKAKEWNEKEILINVGGMSLRDYFAAKALSGLCAHLFEKSTAQPFSEWAACLSYEVADEMLRRRVRT